MELNMNLINLMVVMIMTFTFTSTENTQLSPLEVENSSISCSENSIEDRQQAIPIAGTATYICFETCTWGLCCSLTPLEPKN
ncbi:MAG TPA: hypothetical protein DCE78_10320 [Bacteroidetes bacterium]|nr:hypothetical protein [Bacteroidota bacterium]